MSEWKEKDQRLDVAFNTDVRFMCVEHPSFVKNPDKAIETLGGLQKLALIYSDPQKRLPMRYRVKDAYSKATYGDRSNVTNLAMKVIRRRRKSDGKEEYKVVILGLIETAYKFQSLIDFQYLPMRTNKEGKFESIYEQVRINRLVPRKEYLKEDAPLFIPPILFSRSDKPVDFQYKQTMIHKEGYKDPEKSRPENLIGTMRQRRSIFTIFVNFGERLPTAPIPAALKRIDGEFVDHNAGEVLKQLFSEQPLYLKAEIEHRTGYRQQILKVFLPAMCFYWLDGPWRGQWNKFGFDPTKNPSAKIYQTIDFRIRQIQPGQLDIKAKRGANKLFQWNQVVRNQKHNVKINLKALRDDYIEDKEQDHLDKEILYKFTKDTIPPNRMMYYPVCYVELPEVQELLHKNDGKERVCTEKDGWCVEDFSMHCRDIMYQYLNKLLSVDDCIESKSWRTKKKKRKIAKIRYDSDPEDPNMYEDASNDMNTDNILDYDENDIGNLAGVDDFGETTDMPGTSEDVQYEIHITENSDIDVEGSQVVNIVNPGKVAKDLQHAMTENTDNGAGESSNIGGACWTSADLKQPGEHSMDVS